MTFLSSNLQRLALTGVLLVAALVGLVAWQPWKSDSLSARYTIERGEGATQGTVNSPLKVTLQVPGSDGSAESALAGVELQLLNTSGQSARFGDGKETSFFMKPTTTIGTWEYNGSVPSDPGAYHLRVQLTRLYGEGAPQVVELKDPVLTAVEEQGPPLSSGFVFPFEGNLWLLATDASRQRRLTYFPPSEEYADKPAWSPDGKIVAFTYLPKVTGSDLPSTEIWRMGPDGGNKHVLAPHGKNESLSDPTWSPDGKYVYFGVDTIVAPGSGLSGSGQNRRIDRVELATGKRNAVVQGSQAPHVGASGEMLYLEDTVPSDAGGSPGQRLMLASPDNARESELVNDTTYQRMLAPHVSPGGTWVVFSAVNVPPAKRSTGFDLFKWLLWEPEVASAHGNPWDLFLVPSTGGPATRLTTLDEDEPYPTWMDNNTIAFMGATGLYRLSIDSSGNPAGAPTKLDEGSRHGGLTWHAP